MRNAAAFTLAIVTGVGGYALRWRQQPSPKLPQAGTVSMARTAAPDAHDAAGDARPSRVPGDCQTCKNQLAICMAYHPPADEKDKQLVRCRAENDALKDRPTLPECYDFIDFLPMYDRELGELDPSPETLERAKNMTPQSCVAVIDWERRALFQLGACLKGETPPGFKEKYALPPSSRPLAKACHSQALHEKAVDAWITRDEDRVREMGHKVTRHMHLLPNHRFELVPVPEDSGAPSGGEAPLAPP
jgi:hypothetical protein